MSAGGKGMKSLTTTIFLNRSHSIVGLPMTREMSR